MIVYFSHLNKLVDQYSNNYHHSISKRRIHADYSPLDEKNGTNRQSLKLMSQNFEV